MNLTRRKLIGTAAVTAAFGVACPAILRAQAAKLVVGMVPVNSLYWDLDVAIEKGFFKEAGFEPEANRMQSSPFSIQQAITGAYQIAASQPEPFVAAVERGASNLGALAAPMNRADWYLSAQKDVKSVADLKGKVIGVSALRNSEVWLTVQLLEKAGLKKGDYDFLVVGVTPQKMAALNKGSIAATVLFQPTATLAAQGGFHTLASYAQLRTYPPVLYVVNKEWAAKDNAGKRAATAVRKAHEWLWNSANKVEAIQILNKYTKQPDAILGKVYDDYFLTQKSYSRTGEIEISGLNNALADMAEDGEIIKKPAPPASKFLLDKSLGGMSV